jgi:hypothetical protein
MGKGNMGALAGLGEQLLEAGAAGGLQGAVIPPPAAIISR